MKNENIGESPISELTTYVKAIFNQKNRIIVGKLGDGKFMLNIENNDNMLEINTLMLEEENFFGMVAASILYCKHYNINLSEKIDELNEGNDFKYVFPSQE